MSLPRIDGLYQSNKSSAISPSGSQLVGEYSLGRKLGEGSWGSCVRAVKQESSDPFAVRALSKSFDTKKVNLLKSYVRVADSIATERFQKAIEVIEARGQAYLVSNFVGGIDLSQLIRTQGRLSIKKSIYCVARAIEGLEAAYKKQIVHGELRPSKMMVDRNGSITIRDLAIAQISSQRSRPVADVEPSAPNFTAAQLQFAAPEILSGQAKPRLASDIYSLGCILFYLLTGRPVFPYRKPNRIVKAHLQQPIPIASRYVKGVPPALDACLAKMLAKEPSARFQSYKECHTKLREINQLLPSDEALASDQWQQAVDAASQSHDRAPTAWGALSNRWVWGGVGAITLIGTAIAGYAILWRTPTSDSSTNRTPVRGIPVSESEDVFEIR